MKKKYDFGVFIGRFQPLHLGHEHVIREALESVNKLIVLIGSANRAPDMRNPFTFEQREEMFKAVFSSDICAKRIIVKPLPDHKYADTAWCVDVQRIVKETVLYEGNNGGIVLHGTQDFSVALAGFGKDDSSYYLKLFPQWDSLKIDSPRPELNATDIRDSFFRQISDIPYYTMSDGVVDFLKDYPNRYRDYFPRLVEDAEYFRKYSRIWGDGPFLTADAVVIQSGHILLIKRGEVPGKGFLALPGGFVEPHETMRQAAVRELREETKISDDRGELPPGMLDSYIKDVRVLDDPYRSLRGRVLTTAFLFCIPGRQELLTVTGSDDAASAKWYRIGDLNPKQFFEDHWFIINMMANL